MLNFENAKKSTHAIYGDSHVYVFEGDRLSLGLVYLQGFKDHKLYDPLQNPGSADLTADVDFAYLKHCCGDKGQGHVTSEFVIFKFNIVNVQFCYTHVIALFNFLVKIVGFREYLICNRYISFSTLL